MDDPKKPVSSRDEEVTKESSPSTMDEETVEVLSPFYFAEKSRKFKAERRKSDETTGEGGTTDAEAMRRIWQGRSPLRPSQMLGGGEYQITELLATHLDLRRYRAIDRNFCEVWIVELPVSEAWDPDVVERLATIPPFSHLREGFREAGRTFVVMAPVQGVPLIAFQPSPNDRTIGTLCAEVLLQIEGMLQAGIDPTLFDPHAFFVTPEEKLCLVEFPLEPLQGLPGDFTPVLEFAARLIRLVVQSTFGSLSRGETDQLQYLDLLPVSEELRKWLKGAFAAIERFSRKNDLDAVTGFLAGLREEAERIGYRGDFQITAGCLSDIGAMRERNEDAVGIFAQEIFLGQEPFRLNLLAVADGMGGHVGGEIAAQMTIQTFALRVFDFIHSLAPQVRLQVLGNNQTLRERLLEIIDETNLAIERLGSWPEFREKHAKPGATLCFALLLGRSVFIGNVGDSRAYLLRDGCLQRLTRDHSLIQLRIDRGEIASEEEAADEDRGVIMAHIGLPHLHHKDVFIHVLYDDDLLLLCSDGLTGMLREGEIERIAAEITDPQFLCRELVRVANERGGMDNISVAVARIDPVIEEA
ncbi:MAG: serine/threonine-protein phosphatase, partial [Deltaproteobacteria bacterium]